MAAARPRGGEPRLGPVADQVAIELGERREDVKDEPAAWGGRVDGFLQAAEADLAVREACDRVDEVAQ